MQNFSTLRVERDRRGVVRLELNRPGKYTAINDSLISDLRTAARELAADNSVRVVIAGTPPKPKRGVDVSLPAKLPHGQ